MSAAAGPGPPVAQPMIMTAVDGSAHSLRALPVAVALARLAEGRVHLVRVFDVATEMLSARAGIAGIPDTRAALQAEARDELAELAERCRTAGVECDAALLDDEHIARALVEHGRERAAAVIVMATHGRGFIRRAVLGSVADRVARESDRAVVLVPPHDEERSDDAGLRARRLRRLVVGLDETADPDRAAERVLAVPGVRQLEIALARVVIPTVGSGLAAPELMLAPDGAAGLERSARASLSAVEERLRAAGVPAQLRVERAESAAAGLLAAAADADLIALTTHARRGLRRMVMGSTATAVVRQARVPVLLWNEAH